MPSASYIPPVDRYREVLARLAVPYRVDDGGVPIPSLYPATTLAPAGGLVTTVRDFARFDLALKNNLILLTETRALAWSPPSRQDGERLPHGLGWFVQTHDLEPVVWQFGGRTDASSSLVVTLPARGLTLVLLANSDGLAQPFALEARELTASPFGRLFLEMFVR